MAYDHSIGTRTFGKPPARHERWYLCAVCGRRTPDSETTIPEAPYPHAGSRVCLISCSDEPSYDVFQILAPYTPSGEEDGP